MELSPRLLQMTLDRAVDSMCFRARWGGRVRCGWSARSNCCDAREGQSTWCPHTPGVVDPGWRGTSCSMRSLAWLWTSNGTWPWKLLFLSPGSAESTLWRRETKPDVGSDHQREVLLPYRGFQMARVAFADTNFELKTTLIDKTEQEWDLRRWKDYVNILSTCGLSCRSAIDTDSWTPYRAYTWCPPNRNCDVLAGSWTFSMRSQLAFFRYSSLQIQRGPPTSRNRCFHSQISRTSCNIWRCTRVSLPIEVQMQRSLRWCVEEA